MCGAGANAPALSDTPESSWKYPQDHMRYDCEFIDVERSVPDSGSGCCRDKPVT